MAANPLGGVVGLWRWTSFGPSAMYNGIVEITENNGVLTGKVISYFPKPGDPANPSCDKCAGATKGQPIIGLVVLEGLKKNGDTYEGGTILDPETGTVYSFRAKLIDGGKKLEVRGFVGVSLIGRRQTWIREE